MIGRTPPAPLIPGAMPTAREWNETQELLSRASYVDGANVHVLQSAGTGIFLSYPAAADRFLIKTTGKADPEESQTFDNYYAWTRQTRNPDAGAFENHPHLVQGDLSFFPAIEINGNADVPDGTLAEAWISDDGEDVLFDAGGAGESSSIQVVIDGQTFSVSQLQLSTSQFGYTDLENGILSIYPPTVPYGCPCWYWVTLDYTDFATASGVNSVKAFTLPAGGRIHAIKAKHTTAFSGGSIIVYYYNGLGILGDLDKYNGDGGFLVGNNYDMTVAPGDRVGYTSDSNPDFYGTPYRIDDHNNDTDVYATVNCGGASLDEATAGEVEIGILASVAKK